MAEQASEAAPLAADAERAWPGNIRSQLQPAARTAAVLVGWSVALGLVLGPLWALVAPEVLVTVRDGSAFLSQEQGAMLIGVDGWFTVLGVLAGVAIGALAWWRYRHQIIGMLAGSAIGGFLGSVIAWRVGVWLGPGALESRVDGVPDGTQIAAPLTLAAKAALLAWPIAAVSVVFLLALVEPRGGARGGRHAVMSQRPAEADEPASS